MVAEQPDADVSSMDCDSRGQGPDGPPLEAFHVILCREDRSPPTAREVKVRAERSTEATVLGFRAYLDIVHGRLMGNWVELEGEPGYMLAGFEGVTLLERVVSPAANAGATVVA